MINQKILKIKIVMHWKFIYTIIYWHFSNYLCSTLFWGWLSYYWKEVMQKDRSWERWIHFIFKRRIITIWFCRKQKNIFYFISWKFMRLKSYLFEKRISSYIKWFNNLCKNRGIIMGLNKQKSEPSILNLIIRMMVFFFVKLYQLSDL